MEHYIDLRVRPDPEFSQATLMSAMFAKLHRALVRLHANDVGVSFPEHLDHPRALGSVLRVHATEERLQRLMELRWLSGMHDHIQSPSIQPIPPNSLHRMVYRVQPKTNADRLRRRHMRRHAVPADVARARIPERLVGQVLLPFVTLRSKSTGESFCLFVEHGPIGAEPTSGTFSRYGLSRSGTVPWF